MSPIKDFQITCEALNEAGTFSAGDTVIGEVTFYLTKDTHVKSLLVKAKGEAHVYWTEGSGDDSKSYSAHKRYFKDKKYLVGENAKDNKLHRGLHNFKFRLTIPHGNMPPSFKGNHGYIVYKVEAKLSRSFRMSSTAQKELDFVSKSSPCTSQCPQSGSVKKEMGGFSRGEVQMSATVDRQYFSPGDNLSVVAKICNSSSKKMRPKFKLLQKTTYHAGSSSNTSYTTLFKMVGDTIQANSEETASCKVTIPLDAMYTLSNCEIISVEYHIKVYLDISFAIDPEVVFPLVIGPYSSGACDDMGPYQAGMFGAPSYSDFPTSTFTGFSPVPIGSGYHALDPTQQGYTPSGYNNQWTQNTIPYGFSATPFMPPSVHPPATEQPPSYMYLHPNADKNG
ncbi:arrestin domain-containing protein 3-like [Melanotaenia boesemani]|uniref:arrestin domain-containing protein 3-like n=1 Tax=Melanotaenia boesemani TaxID=1250792 RepID=UPI001C055286|nr:arrestin domain-containing protein 3-like [Melanotaenia boesemani]